MANYLEYLIDDGSKILVEAGDGAGEIVRASRSGMNVVETGKNFTQAFASIRGSLKAIAAELDILKIDEAEVKFGIKAVGEAGVFAVGKVGGEMNYEITLKWRKPVENEK